MAVISIKIKNLARVRRALDKHPQVAGRHIANAINMGLADIRQATLPITPRKTGNLRSSFDRGGTIPATPKTLKGTIGPNLRIAPYAIFVHDFGGKTRYQNPTTAGTRPQFLERGARKATRKVNDRFRKALDNITRELTA